MDESPPRGLGRLALLCLAYSLVFMALGFPRTIPTFWSADNGFKWWQARVLAEQGWSRPWAEYPERDIDPDGKFQPLGWKYGRLEPEGLRFTYPPAVAALFAPFAGTGSFRLALAGQALIAGWCLFLVGVIARDLGVRQFEWIAIGLFGCSPWIAYVLELNEHIPALGLGLAAWVLASPAKSGDSFSRSLGAGALIGLAGLLRNELVLWGAALGLALWLTRRRWSGVGIWAGTLLVFGLGAWVQLALSPESAPIRVTEIHEDIPESSFGLHALFYRWAILNHWLFGVGHYDEEFERQLFHPGFWVCAVILVAAFLLRRFAPSDQNARRFVRASGFALGIGACGLWCGWILRGVPEASGLLLVFPLLALLLVSPAIRGVWAGSQNRAVWIAVAVFGFLLWFGVGNSRGGRQWGPRYLMIIWPFLMIFAWKVCEWGRAGEARVQRGWILPLLAAGLLATGWAGFQARVQQDTEVVSALAELSAADRDQVFVTPHEYLPGAAGGVGHLHWMLVPEKGSDTEAELLTRLANERGGFVWIGRRPPVETDWSGLNKRTIQKYLIYAIKNKTQSFDAESR